MMQRMSTSLGVVISCDAINGSAMTSMWPRLHDMVCISVQMRLCCHSEGLFCDSSHEKKRLTNISTFLGLDCVLVLAVQGLHRSPVYPGDPIAAC